MVVLKESYCIIGDCNRPGERSHLIARANLPKELWDDERFYIWLCRRHHSEQHSIGIESFCARYSISSLLCSAREHFAEYKQHKVND